MRSIFSYFVENIHFFFLRITLFNKLNLKISVLKPNTYECFKLFYEVMNPSSAVWIQNSFCKFIREALELR